MSMSIPTSYTEISLATFMLAALGDVALAIDMTLAKLAEPVNDAMLVYGIRSARSPAWKRGKLP